MSPICRVRFPQVGDGQTTAGNAVAWANRIIETFSGVEAAVFDSPSLPDLTVAIEDSDTAELLVLPHDSIPYSISDPDSQYPAHFRIPPSTLRDLPEKECKKRAQRFAVGSLIYTIMHSKPPFADLDEGIVQQNFENGVYPVETMSFPQGIAIAILGFWSQEFAEAIMELSAHKDQTSLSSKILKYMKAHPVRTFGLGVFGVASLINPALGIAGFSAVGPTAGTAAAAWQSSIGLVQAGSFFAWCQSAAMGGAAAGAIGAAQGVGAGIAALGGILGCSTDEEKVMRMVCSLFTEKVRKKGEGDADREKGEGDSDTEVEDGVKGGEQDSSKGIPPQDTDAKL
ncbi:hypothetical protein DL766_008105 [Monosporascus sp. MC13-8B]|uniref:Protein kinase domain-containing protein n=1 Tax=Monosporascus cannonballus TaxID=155416 RepID=A0ABY0GVY8_9PEZI|nr:hypothetical protein DL762_009637 [Monosporascus cannonballus]RYO79518.1 hypothetical protein DL763_009239 [Monosporascus cannonballus]RYP20760.1 hypothetical protein DL766_008105 [Monosporascus sp. MC13-8B]